MSLPPLPNWAAQASDARFSLPADCAIKANAFERRIRLRNALEYIVGAFVIVLFLAATAGAFYKGETLIALSLFAIVIGVIVALVELKRRGSNLERRPEDDCLTHLRRQYQRQYEALRSVPLWYIGPFMPGLVLFYLSVTAGAAEVMGWTEAVSGIAGPAAISFGLLAVIALANWIGARALKSRLDALDALASPDPFA